MGGGVRNAKTFCRRFQAALSLSFLASVMISAPAAAGAWTRPAGKGLIISSASHHSFDLEGTGFGYSKLETAVYLEYGLTDRFTLLGRVSRETRFHQSRVEVRKGGSVFLQSVNTVSSALGDSEIGVRAQLAHAQGWALSAQTALVRFGREPNPLLKDDARWGADARLMLGRSLGETLFAEAQLGRRADWDGERTETRLDLTLGVRPSERWLLLAQSYSAWGEGGWSAYRRTYESHRVHLSVIAPLTEGLSLQLGAINSVTSDRIAPERAYMVSLWREF